jgi:stage II sporulation protein GA (sporulation sigma-E factor processing peptidase)
MEILYLDLYFLVNLLADYLLCLAAARLCGLRLRRRRCLLAALFGAGYALICTLPGLGLLASPAGILGSGLLLGGIAFWGEARFLRCVLSLLLLAFALGGGLYALTLRSGGAPVLSLRLLLCSFFVFYGLLKLLSRFRSRWDGSDKARVRLILAGREASFPALIDSGNSLRDPATGAEVLIVSPRALQPLFPGAAALLEELSPVELLEAQGQLPALSGRLRLISYRSLSGGGLLPLFRPDALYVNGKPCDDLLVALSPEARGDGFEAIL